MASTALILARGACRDEDALTASCAYKRTSPVATSKSPTYGRVKIPQGLDRTS
jgi:hypothetical protein